MMVMKKLADAVAVYDDDDDDAVVLQ